MPAPQAVMRDPALILSRRQPLMIDGFLFLSHLYGGKSASVCSGERPAAAVRPIFPSAWGCGSTIRCPESGRCPEFGGHAMGKAVDGCPGRHPTRVLKPADDAHYARAIPNVEVKNRRLLDTAQITSSEKTYHHDGLLNLPVLTWAGSRTTSGSLFNLPSCPVPRDMAGPAGLEPATCRLEVGCSIRLS